MGARLRPAGSTARGIATCYDKAPESYLAGLHLRAATIWIDDLLKTAD
ncbi:hypothetical protein [Streptomyces sp. NPDC101206]